MWAIGLCDGLTVGRYKAAIPERASAGGLNATLSSHPVCRGPVRLRYGPGSDEIGEHASYARHTRTVVDHDAHHVTDRGPWNDSHSGRDREPAGHHFPLYGQFRPDPRKLTRRDGAMSHDWNHKLHDPEREQHGDNERRGNVLVVFFGYPQSFR